MKTRRVFRRNRKTPEQRIQEQALREKLQQTKPSLDDLIRRGEFDPDAVMTMGMYADLQEAIQTLKQERLRAGQSVSDVAERSGLDRAVVSRLENGKQENPTVATLMRYAAAIGKRILWSYEDVAEKAPVTNGKARQRRTA